MAVKNIHTQIASEKTIFKIIKSPLIANGDR